MALILSYIEQKKWSYLVTLNGALTGKIKGLRPNYYTFIPKKMCSSQLSPLKEWFLNVLVAMSMNHGLV